MTDSNDIHYMRHALALGRRGLGRAAPNPAVGCVLVREGRVAATGFTGDGGRPHAEAIALEKAGGQARGAAAYVSFEPCAHEGKTPSCAKALIAAGIARAVIACEDPDPRTAGQGIALLKEAGIEVATGVLEDEARALNRGFILRITENRPLVTLKTATSKDGKIAYVPGKQHWITGPLSRRRVHLERSLHDAVLVGIGTVLADDPTLTARLPDCEHKTVRVVLDTHLRIATDSQLVKTCKGYPLWVFHGQGDEAKAAKLEKAGALVFQADTADIPAVLARLAEEGITRLLVEGGAKIHTAFLDAGFCDRLLRFTAPATIGPQGLAALEGHDIDKIEQEFGLTRREARVLDEDLLELYERA